MKVYWCHLAFYPCYYPQKKWISAFILHPSPIVPYPLCLSEFREVKVARRTFTQPSPLTRMDSSYLWLELFAESRFFGIEKWKDIVHNDNRWRCLSYYLSDINRFIRYLIYLSETLDISLIITSITTYIKISTFHQKII